jgi:DNA-binding response OmpR family regulator
MSDPKDEEKGRALGAVDYIVKPVDFSTTVMVCIEKHINAK